LYSSHRFATKESATHAIVAVHNTEINGQSVKCSWGKEAGDPANVTSQVSNVIIIILWSSDAKFYPCFQQRKNDLIPINGFKFTATVWL
jgi:hypothetical protein